MSDAKSKAEIAVRQKALADRNRIASRLLAVAHELGGAQRRAEEFEWVMRVFNEPDK